eukprot:5967918-Amphidinium_carterae.1
MVKHVGFTHNRFQVGQDGQIPVRLEPQWSYGIRIGRDTADGSHLTLTSERLYKSRSVRRLIMSQ